MLSIWTKHLDTDAEKEQFERGVKNSSWLLERLSKILTDMERDLDRAETNPKTYDIPNWDYRQAHNNGFRQSLNIMQRLINVKEQDDRKLDRTDQSTGNRPQ
jgi:hypothetical protein